jgi:hypothetical protein
MKLTTLCGQPTLLLVVIASGLVVLLAARALKGCAVLIFVNEARESGMCKSGKGRVRKLKATVCLI